MKDLNVPKCYLRGTRKKAFNRLGKGVRRYSLGRLLKKHGGK